MRNNWVINFLADDVSYPNWVVNSFPIIKIVLAVLIAICAILITVLVMCQKTEDGTGSNVITGQADTFYNRNKGESLQGKIRKATIALSVIIFVLCITFVIINAVYPAY